MMVKASLGLTKKILAGILGGAMLIGMIGCGAGSENKASDIEYDSYYEPSGGNKGTVSSESIADADMAWDGYYEVPKETLGSGEEQLVPTSARKTIKTARLTLQTLDFDVFAAALELKIAETGAYLQYADVSGSNYYGGRRYASYTIRVPEARFHEFLSGLEGIATITNRTLGEEDVTLSYVDTESRIKTLEIEMERLLALLEKADSLESIIVLEERLSEVRYQLERYQAQLRTYDDQISYSTVTLSVNEVAKVTEPEPETIWERISSGWENTIEDITESFQNFVVWFVINIPYLIFWAVVIVVVVIVLKKRSTKRKQRKLEKQREKNETKLGSEE